ncbi:hypothetical protein [Deinococcus aluminii]|uniref:AMP-binding protein n=1 Tax=Deinococcus aluminii TaxID=1656885 RepID=A0ABP9XES1_9DEIO
MTMTETAYDLALDDAFEDQQRLVPLERGQATLATLRRVWVDVKGKAALPRWPANDLTGLAQQLLHFGCGARDDDGFVVYVVRAGRLHGHTWIDDRARFPEAARELARLGLRVGDSVIALHRHNCAADCFALADAFLHGARLT